MNNYLKIILIFTFLITHLMADKTKYWLVEEFEKNNPKQKILSHDFNNLVQNSSVPLGVKQNKVIKIAIVYPGIQASDYWRRSKDSFAKRLNELNIQYELTDHFTKPAVAIKEQAKHLLKAINNDTDYLVFALDAFKHLRFVERILSKKKPKLILQNITTPVKIWGEKQPFLYVGFDHVIGSKLLADYYLQEVGKEGNYAVLYGSNGYVSSMRGDEFIHYMNQKSDLKLKESYYTNFNKEKSMNATNEILDNNKNLDFIYACSTDIALGVIEVLKKRDLIGKIKVNGWGGGSSELKAIEKNQLDVTVMRMNDDNGVAMAEAIKLDLEGKTKKVPQVYSGDFKLVKKGVDKKTLKEFKNRAFRYTN